MLDKWTWKMAWRDSRGSRRRLLMFLSSMVLGVAALVAINSFGENLERTIDAEAKTLLGADYSLERDEPFAPETEAIIDTLGGEQSRRVSFASMALFPRTGDTRLATVRAHEGGYPFYGEIVTQPLEAATTYLEGQNALVDGTLMNEFGVVVGDSVRIGTLSYLVVGRLEKTPRESAAIMLFSPRIYIPAAHLDTTLLAQGSRAEYEVFFKFEEGRDVDALDEQLQEHRRAFSIGSDTVSEEKEDWGGALSNLYRFLGLVGFMALLLGALGVASSVHVYVRQRLDTVAVLRCMGAKVSRTYWVYVIQAACMGLLGSAFGCLLGIGVQVVIPYIIGDFLPFEVDFSVSWTAMVFGVGIGVGVTLLFALLPLLTVRRVSPLRALRAAVEETPSHRDAARWMIYGVIAVGLVLFASLQAPTVGIGVSYALGIAAVFGLLALVAKGLIVAARRYFPSTWTYPWRQGLANLYRPGNQTLILMLSLGLGTFLIMTMLLVERSLIQQLQVAGGEGRPDMVFFDIQNDQLEGVQDIIREQGLAVLDHSPIVTMRISAVKGRTVEEMRADSTTRTSWAHRREYRSTYRDYLTDTETLVEGTFTGEVAEGTEVIPISLEREAAGRLEVGINDTLVIDVQGIPFTTTVGSIREVDWQRMQTNFFIVFPKGVLEEAPQIHVVMTRTDNDEVEAQLQQAVVQSYPNVSSIGLSLVLKVFDAIFSRGSLMVRFMALFSILTGIIVLIGAVMISRFKRIEESVLLKTLGASRAQVFKIMLIEYLFLGVFSTVTGLLLAVIGSWALARFVFEITFVAAPLPLLIAGLLVTTLTIVIGLLNSRGIYARPPLEVLRAEV